MSTGITTWNTNLLDIGPLYPFVGSEMALAFLAIVLWLIWHFLQANVEAREIAEENAKISTAEEVVETLDKQNQQS